MPFGIDPHIATGRQKHHEAPVPPEAAAPSAEAAAPSAEASAKEKMQSKLRTATGKALYAVRKHIVEPVFGMIKSARGIRKFLLRGLEKVSAEWQLICLTHNLLKIWRRSCSVGVTHRAASGSALTARELLVGGIWFPRRFVFLLSSTVPRVSGRFSSGASCP